VWSAGKLGAALAAGFKSNELSLMVFRLPGGRDFHDLFLRRSEIRSATDGPLEPQNNRSFLWRNGYVANRNRLWLACRLVAHSGSFGASQLLDEGKPISQGT
jgi:hypothetical protein